MGNWGGGGEKAEGLGREAGLGGGGGGEWNCGKWGMLDVGRGWKKEGER